MAHAFSVWLLLLLPAMGIQDFDTRCILPWFLSMQNITLFLNPKYCVNMYVFLQLQHTHLIPGRAQCNVMYYLQ